MGNGIRLCRLSDVLDGASRGFDPWGAGRDTVFVVHRSPRVYAYRNACPHWKGAPMAWRKDGYLNHDGTRIVCHAHGAQFAIETGVCVLGPCLGESLQPVAVTVTAEGEIRLLPNNSLETSS